MHAFVASGLDQHRGELPEQYQVRLQELWQLQELRIGQASELRLESGEELDSRLELAGLTGQELELKRLLYEDAVTGYEERPTPTRFADVLAAADVTLNSLALILPIVEGVKELKEVIEHLFSWGRGWLRRFLRRWR